MKGFFKLMTKKKIEFFTSNMIYVTLEVTTKPAGLCMPS